MKGKTKTPRGGKAKSPQSNSLALAVLASALGAAFEPSFAQAIPASVRTEERIEFSIAAQPLSGALSEFARQAAVNALYFDDDLRGRSAPQVAGTYTREEAFVRLLDGPGYSCRVNGANLVLVQNAPRPRDARCGKRPALRQVDRPGDPLRSERFWTRGSRGAGVKQRS